MTDLKKGALPLDASVQTIDAAPEPPKVEEAPQPPLGGRVPVGIPPEMVGMACQSLSFLAQGLTHGTIKGLTFAWVDTSNQPQVGFVAATGTACVMLAANVLQHDVLKKAVQSEVAAYQQYMMDQQRQAAEAKADGKTN